MASITLRYSEPLIRRVIRAWWRRRIGWVSPALVVLLGVFVALRVAGGDRGWVVGAVGAVVLLAVAVAVGSYRVHLHRSLARFHRMKTPEATMDLDDEGLRVVSDVGATELRWSVVRELWRLDGAWLIFLSEGAFMTLPTEGLTPQVRDFIVSRVEAHGGRVV